MDQVSDVAALAIFIIFFPIFFLYFLGLWRLFEKAGHKGWEAIIPFYNLLVWLKIIGRPSWWVLLLLLVPIVNVFIWAAMTVELLKSFGKNRLYQHGLGVAFGWIYFPYISFKKDVKYLGKASELPKGKKSSAREWADAIIFAVVAATLIRWLLLEAFKIPTPSMEKTLLMGDFLFVSKVHYGARTPQTPLQVPLTHQYWWWSEKSKSYLDWIQLPQYRLPGISEVKNNDVVVFNWPADNAHDPVDLKTNYIKRCMGIAGDTLRIINRQFYINGKAAENPPLRQYIYKVYTERPIPKRIFKKYDIPNYGQYEKRLVAVDRNKAGYIIDMTPEIAQKFVETGIADSVKITDSSDPNQRQALFPMSKNTENWTIDDYGPLWIPKKGSTITMNKDNVGIYAKTIEDYEGWEEVKVADDKLYINGKEIKEYTFQKNYYFMAGDNRHSSYDSRFWGFVPDNYIVGKALFIWFSMDPDPNKGTFEAIRWDRVFDGIK